jgi:SAM-dependent methyltransferase
MTFPHEQNRHAWDLRVIQGKPHTQPATQEEFLDPMRVIDECGWLKDGVAAKRVLCLAAGGGKHGPLLAAAGASVTVVDISPMMLELDRRIAAQRGLRLDLIEASMDHLAMLESSSFDLVIQPVSTCYVPDVVAVYREVSRVTAPDGLYISQHKQPACLQAEMIPSGGGYRLIEPYYRCGPLPPALDHSQHREAGTAEFLHRWEELLGGLCRTGFLIEDLVEPRHGEVSAEPGTFAHRSAFVPPFLTVKARRIGNSSADSSQSKKLWTP